MEFQATCYPVPLSTLALLPVRLQSQCWCLLDKLQRTKIACESAIQYKEKDVPRTITEEGEKRENVLRGSKDDKTVLFVHGC